MASFAPARKATRPGIASGSLDLLKWLALAAMILDHANAVFYDRTLPLAVEVIGRIAMPIFALTCGYNLGRPGADLPGAVQRLATFGLLALPAHAALFAQVDGWYPLNVLFGFAVAACCIWAADQCRYELAAATFLIGGALVEYWWPGVALVIAGAYYARKPTAMAAGGVLASLVALCVVNGNPWAMAALLPLLAAFYVDAGIPRSGRWIIALYPAHLVALWVMANG